MHILRVSHRLHDDVTALLIRIEPVGRRTPATADRSPSPRPRTRNKLLGKLPSKKPVDKPLPPCSVCCEPIKKSAKKIWCSAKLHAMCQSCFGDSLTARCGRTDSELDKETMVGRVILRPLTTSDDL